jgi:hypothetical protein
MGSEQAICRLGLDRPASSAQWLGLDMASDEIADSNAPPSRKKEDLLAGVTPGERFAALGPWFYDPGKGSRRMRGSASRWFIFPANRLMSSPYMASAGIEPRSGA